MTDLIKRLTENTCGEESCDACTELRKAAAIEIDRLQRENAGMTEALRITRARLAYLDKSGATFEEKCKYIDAALSSSLPPYVRAEEWTKTLPTEPDSYLWWGYGWTSPRNVEDLGGWWMRWSAEIERVKGGA